MDGVPNKFPAGFQNALAALYSREPMTPADVAEHNSRVAVQKRRDDLARVPAPDLLDGAQ